MRARNRLNVKHTITGLESGGIENKISYMLDEANAKETLVLDKKKQFAHNIKNHIEQPAQHDTQDTILIPGSSVLILLSARASGCYTGSKPGISQGIPTKSLQTTLRA